MLRYVGWWFSDRFSSIEIEIRDTTDTARSASCLDIHLKIGSKGQLRRKHYDKRDDLKLTVNFPFICINIQAVTSYGVYISQLI